MAVTNIGPKGPPDGGLRQSEGTPIRQVILNFTDEIVGASGSRWSKVTDSTTPSELQPYASTIDDTNTGNNSRGFNEQITLYLDDDPSLNFSTPAARMIRFSRTEAGFVMSAIDTVHSDAATDHVEWIKAIRNTNSTENDSKIYFLEDQNPAPKAQTFQNRPKGNPGPNNTTYTNNQGLQQDTKFFYYLTSDYIWINAYSLEGTNNFGSRGGAFYHPSPPANGTISREDHPFIWQMSCLSAYSTDGNQKHLWTSAALDTGAGFGIQQNGRINSFIFPDSVDYQDRNIASPCFVVRNGNNRNAWHFDEFIPEMRVTSNNVFASEDNDFPVRTIGGEEWFLAGGQAWGDNDYALKLTGNV